ncbi:MAG: NADH-quinone oxidoreductase subunit J [Desulfobulbus oligotrophicus]|jgi:NADH-quinone oxidoreductase subunit J|nr:NADH-quinone oxidoreductase subunit J [Desulfobulbus oligotrophicus]
MQEIICQAEAPADLFSAEAMVGLIFLMAVFLVVAGAVVAVASGGRVRSMRLVRAIAGLAVCFSGLAIVYYYLLSPFLAMMQLLIYVGAVSVLIAFGIMMATPDAGKLSGMKNPAALAGPLALGVGGLLFAGLTVLVARTQWQPWPRQKSGDIEAIGLSLLTTHSMVFELISIVLLMAIIGALVLARKGRS